MTSGQLTVTQRSPAQLATNQLAPNAGLVAIGEAGGENDARRLRDVSRNTAEEALWHERTPGHVVSHAETPQDHVASHVLSRDYVAVQSETSRDFVVGHSGLSRDQQVSVIFNADLVDRTVNYCTVSDDRRAQPTQTTERVFDLLHGPTRHPENSVCTNPAVNSVVEQTSVMPQQSAAGFATESERRPRARPAGSTRPCVLRRGRAIYSTDYHPADDAAGATIDVATCQDSNTYRSASTVNDIADFRRNDEVVPNVYDENICYPEKEKPCSVSGNASDIQNFAENTDQCAPPAENASNHLSEQMTAPDESSPEKMSPPSLCSDCDTDHRGAPCPLHHPRCWVQDSPGGSAVETLPACLRIDGSTVRVGPEGLAAYTLLGPLTGRPVRPEQLVESVDLRHIWEVSEPRYSSVQGDIEHVTYQAAADAASAVLLILSVGK